MQLRVGSILVAILALVAAPTFAQSVTGEVKVGANLSKVVVNEDDGGSSNRVRRPVL